MRYSALRHPLAVLRTMLGLKQPDFAALVGSATSTIQSVELGPERKELSRALALKVEAATGASASWLLQGDPSKPPLDKRGNPYTRETFAAVRAGKFHAGSPAQERAAAAGPEAACCRAIAEILDHAARTNHLEYAVHRIGDAVLEIAAEVGFEVPPSTRLLMHVWHPAQTENAAEVKSPHAKVGVRSARAVKAELDELNDLSTAIGELAGVKGAGGERPLQLKGKRKRAK